MSSKRTDWQTPEALYKSLDSMFRFNFDPCPPDPDFNGLNIDWEERNFVNPPYGTQIKHWVKKAYEESLKGKLVVMLIPSRTDTRYWHDFVMKAHEIWFVKGRLKFDDCGKPAPFPSAIIVFAGYVIDPIFLEVIGVDTLGRKLS